MKKKLEFYWKYHKGFLFICALGIVMLGLYIYNHVTAPIIYVSGFMLNADSAGTTNARDLENAFIEKYGITSSDGKVMFNDQYICKPGDDSVSKKNYESVREMWLAKSRRNLDFVCGPREDMIKLVYDTIVADTTMFADLRDVLSTKDMAKYEKNFLYIDYDVVKQLEKAFDKKQDTSGIVIPDCTKPEDMKEPIPILIDITSAERLSSIYTSSDSIALGFIEGIAAPCRDAVLEYLEFIDLKEAE